MKAHIYIAGLSCLSFTSLTVNAQEEDTKPRNVSSKFAIGLNTGISTSGGYYYASKSNFGAAIPGTTTGLFARYHIGPHFAMETGVDLGRAERNYRFLKDHELSVSVPINFQYHLLQPQARLRPYFGMGIGYKRTIINDEQYSLNDELLSKSRFTNDEIYLQFTQGLTYQINKHWQLNESLNVQYRNFSTCTFKIGLAYTFR